MSHLTQPARQTIVCRNSSPALVLQFAAPVRATNHFFRGRLPSSFTTVDEKALVLIKSSRHGHRVIAAAQLASASYAPPTADSVVLDVLGSNQPIKLQTGEIGRQANGAVMASCGETVLYATACCAPQPSGDGSFTPLTVNYSERFSAAGRTSAGYIKRDGRPRDSEVLISRLVDRPLRPMFAKGWANETQVLEWVLSYDCVNDPEPLAITAAAAALLISDIPLKKAVAGVRVGLLPDLGFVVNPTVQQMEASSLDLVIAGTRDALLMIEGFCDFLSEEQMLQALEVGSRAITSLCVQMEAWTEKVGQPKRSDSVVHVPEDLVERLMGLVGEDIRQAYRTSVSKEVRSAAISAAESRATQELAAGDGTGVAYTPLQISMALKSVQSRVMRSVVLEERLRADGRGVTDIRPIWSRAGLLPRTHGSALFTRGETQAICVATLGNAGDALRQDSMRKLDEDPAAGRFYLQYHFPPSCVGEVGRTGAPGRRELGHGELAQRALAPVLPSPSTFPYTVRLESTITESNGSSSMASVCGGCLALQDAGVPISRPVAGIAMGLILEPPASTPASATSTSAPRFVVLSDILGSEDALGDMDFKVAGDWDAITAFQMDIKVEGITLDIMAAALAQAREGRRHILTAMEGCNPPPARQLSQYAPRVSRMKIDPAKKGAVIGTGGRNIRLLMEATGATAINIDDEGQVDVCASSESAAALASEYIMLLTSDPAPGTILRGRPVVGLAAFGCFVELCPGRQGMIHVSELSDPGVSEVAAVVAVGDRVDVMVLATDAGGKISLSRRAVIAVDAGGTYKPNPAPSKRTSSSAGGRGGADAGAGGGRGGGDRSRRQ